MQLRDGFQDQFKKSFAPLEVDAELLKQEEYDTENVTVQIVELSTDDIAESNNWIGRNKPVYERAANEKEAGSDGEPDDGDDAEEEAEEELVPGFGVRAPKKKPKAAKAAAADHTATNGEASEQQPKRRKRVTKLPDEVKSKRGMGQFMAKQAHNTLKHTQAFRMKDRLERNKSRKKARIEKEKKIKLQNKREKHTKNSAKGKSKKAPKFNKNSKK